MWASENSSTTRHICANKSSFTSYTSVEDGEEHVYFNDFRTATILRRKKGYSKAYVWEDFGLERYVTCAFY